MSRMADRVSKFHQHTAFQCVSFLLFINVMIDFSVSYFFTKVHSGAKILIGVLVGVKRMGGG